MDFDPTNAQHRGEARRAFWETLMEHRVRFEQSTGRELGPPSREDVERQFREWLAHEGIPAFPFYPSGQ